MLYKLFGDWLLFYEILARQDGKSMSSRGHISASEALLTSMEFTKIQLSMSFAITLSTWINGYASG